MSLLLHTDQRNTTLLRRCAGILLMAAFAAQSAHAQLNDDLVFAAVNDRVPLARELLAKGVDPNTVDAEGSPVLVIAARSGAAGVVDALLAGNAKVNARTPSGDTALMAAAITGNIEIAKKLRQRGAELDGTGWTPLIYAATGGQDAMVTYLLGEGANINAASPNGTTALMMAVREGKGSTVTLLLARGADATRRNQNGASALTWALRNNEKAMADALKRAGATE
jgi:uncharacterized protein